MNNKNYSFIRFELNKSPITDEIINRTFSCPNWANLGDDRFEELRTWIKKTTDKIKLERRKSNSRAKYQRKKMLSQWAAA